GQHSHGSQGAHTHRGTDPHGWMDPWLALEQAKSIQAHAIAKGWVQPEVAAERYAALERRLLALDARWIAVRDFLGGRAVLANHAAYEYPAKRYGIEVHVVDVDPDTELSAETRSRLEQAAKDHGPASMWFESAPHATVVEFLSNDLEIPVRVLSPAESPSDRDAIDSLAADLENLIAPLATHPSPK
ncbi:MAG: zinc ABC transporter substrate-binding protein, partial [Planctomycetes bacterium]|nr:zinc ABC transporter substrate-binding protein [Planctomycetota bacterium]